MNVAFWVKAVGYFFLATSLLSTSLILPSHEQIADDFGPSEHIDIAVFIADSGRKLFVKNLDITFTNATPVPLDVSLPAFGNHFQGARFWAPSSGNMFAVFLRVSYDNLLSLDVAESYAKDVLNGFRDAFELPLNVVNSSSVVNNDTASLDIYYKLDAEANIDTLEKIVSHEPLEGFGCLVARNLFSWYRSGISETVNKNIFNIEHNVIRRDGKLFWNSDLSFGYSVEYRGEEYMKVDLNELLNHTGLIVPSSERPSEISVSVEETERSANPPLKLRCNGSSQPYTTVKEENGILTLFYDLTDPVGNITVAIAVEQEGGISLPNVALAVGVVAVISIAVFIFVKNRGKQVQRERSHMTSSGSWVEVARDYASCYGVTHI